MNNDPIVAAVRRTRDKHAQRFNYDIHAIFADLASRSREKDKHHPVIKDARRWAATLKPQLLHDKPKPEEYDSWGDGKSKRHKTR